MKLPTTGSGGAFFAHGRERKRRDVPKRHRLATAARTTAARAAPEPPNPRAPPPTGVLPTSHSEPVVVSQRAPSHAVTKPPSPLCALVAPSPPGGAAPLVAASATSLASSAEAVRASGTRRARGERRRGDQGACAAASTDLANGAGHESTLACFELARGHRLPRWR